MRNLSTLLLVLLGLPTLSAQSLTVGFEEFGLPVDSFLSEAPNGAFSSPPLEFPNTFDGGFFSGWAISSKTDVTTPGFTNEYSAITGQGADNSLNYAVGFPPFGGKLIIRRASEGTAVERQFRDLFVTNTTYAYLSMLEGDQFAKQFGGPSGDDPDFFSIVIRAYEGGQLLPDSVEFFLADFRFDDNELDYIVSAWTQVNLSNTFDQVVDSLEIDFRSSDVGDFGINTPKYVAIDNVRLEPFVSTSETPLRPAPRIFPNPVGSRLTIREIDSGSTVQLVDSYGRVIRRTVARSTHTDLDTADLPGGVYWLRAEGHAPVRLVKQ